MVAVSSTPGDRQAIPDAGRRWQLQDVDTALFSIPLEDVIRVADKAAAATASTEGQVLPLELLEIGEAIPESGLALDPGRLVFKSLPTELAFGESVTTTLSLCEGEAEITVMARANASKGFPLMEIALNGEVLDTFEIHKGMKCRPWTAKAVAREGRNILRVTLRSATLPNVKSHRLVINDIQSFQAGHLYVRSPLQPPPRDLTFIYRSDPVGLAYLRKQEPMPGFSDLPPPWRYYEVVRDCRPGMPLLLPAEVTFRAPVGPASQLVFSLAAHPDAGHAEPKPLQVSVGIRDQPERILEERELPPSLPAWREVAVGLPEDRRGTGEIVIRLSPVAGQEPPLVILSEPRILADAPPPDDPPRNVILVSLDTLRADHLSCYGYTRKTSPALDNLAAESLLFENAIAPSNWTLPSHASMLSGLYVSTHGVLDLADTLHGLDTLAGIFKSYDYQAVAMADGGLMSACYGFPLGFDNYDSHDSDGLASIVPAATQWLELHSHRPFFMFLHTYDIHAPYDPPQEYKDRYTPPAHVSPDLLNGIANTVFPRVNSPEQRQANLQHIINMYDAGIEYTDDWLGRFLEYLRGSGLWEETLVIVASDHGEEFLEHGQMGHGKTLYEETIRVPLIIHAPGGRARRVERPVEILDIPATIVDWAELETAAVFQGESLLAEQNSGPTPADEKGETAATVAYAEDKFKIAARTDGGKFIYDAREKSQEWYDLNDDPREQVNLVEKGYPVPEDWLPQLKDFRQSNGEILETETSVEAELSPELREQLKNLGYIE